MIYFCFKQLNIGYLNLKSHTFLYDIGWRHMKIIGPDSIYNFGVFYLKLLNDIIICFNFRQRTSGRLNFNKSYLFHISSDGDDFYMTIVATDEIYNFSVLSFSFEAFRIT